MATPIMSTSQANAENFARPRVLRHCSRCQGETAHEIETTDEGSLIFCMPCIERALFYELERD